ncbi:MAG TPA: fasciclin domain-containing protein [Candidatus Babeliales bacterium]|nr:fasciclin domain-containing protein [Candidatus Babeliales bacterium]
MMLKNIAFFALSLLVVVPVAQAGVGTTTTYYGNRVYTNPTAYPTSSNVGTTAIGYTNAGVSSIADQNYIHPNVYSTETNYTHGAQTRYRHGGIISEPVKEKTIVQIALTDPNFSTLVTALKAAGLVELLSGKGPFTVFAPTNAAFAKIPKADLDALLKDKTKLIEVLSNHVVPGKVLSNQVLSLGNAKTAQGGSLKFATNYGKVFVDDAQIVKADINASNGVIHVVDTVLLPK